MVDITPNKKIKKMPDKIVILNITPNFRLNVKICNYYKKYPQYNINKIVGVYNLPFRYNLIRLLVFLNESEIYMSSNRDYVYSYSPHLNKRRIIFQKIYDMSGLIYNNEICWGSSLCCHSAYDVTNVDKEMMGDQISELNTIYRNRVIDLWMFLFVTTPKNIKYIKISLINSIIDACLITEEIHEREEQLKSDYMYMKIIIQNMLEFDEKIINDLIDHYMNEVMWSEATKISKKQAQKMHYDLINQFAKITTAFRQQHQIQLFPTNICFEIKFRMNQWVSEIVTYHTGESEKEDDVLKYFLYDRQYQDFHFNSNGIIQKKIPITVVDVDDANEEGELEIEESDADEDEEVENSTLNMEEIINFDTKKLVGLDNLPLRQNLIRLLFIYYKRKGSIDNSGTYSYSPNLDTRNLIFQKIYDMSGLMFNKKFDWGMYLGNNFNCDIKENILYSFNPFFSRRDNIHILYINRVVDLWLFLLQPFSSSDNFKQIESSVKNLTIRNCIAYENICKEKTPNQAVHNLPMFVIIQHMLDFNYYIYITLVNHFMKQDNWSKLRTISIPLAMKMHCDLLNQFILITKKEQERNITIPPCSEFVINFSNKFKVAEMVAYHSGQGDNIDIYNNQYRNYTININGIIISRKQVSFGPGFKNVRINQLEGGSLIFDRDDKNEGAEEDYNRTININQLESASPIFSNEEGDETETEDDIEQVVVKRLKKGAAEEEEEEEDEYICM
ncbi:hypothetical protein TCON_2467 [Astathelohania contejeani]|uniref:Uncharacterized protein n=1 Tax=Astathelohania contejeani TaxID=164912 RepID=A0ABQ7HVZ9_9MICR|nr:hypothetical protein TCON_2467 [Thelohania contejeani]